MTRPEFFEQTRNALRALAVPFESRELLAWTDGMFSLHDQEPTAMAWAMAHLREQHPVEVEARAEAA
jgi:hypothetical protein